MRFGSAAAASFAAIALFATGCSHATTAISGIGANAGGATQGVLAPLPAGSQHGAPLRRNSSINHVLTWLIIGVGGTTKVHPDQVVQWVDYTMTKQADSVIAHSLGMKTIFYTDPNRVGPGDLMYTKDESTFAHMCNGKRIGIIGGDKVLMDVHSQHLWQLWNDATATEINWGGGGVYDYIFEDTADSMASLRLKGMPCHFDQSDWTKYANKLNSHFNYSIIYNGLSHVPKGQQTPAEAFKLNPTTFGGMAEDCYVGRTPTGYHFAPNWLAMQNTEIGMVQAGKLFVCHGDVYTDASKSQALRTYFYASVLLAYDLGSTIVNTEFKTPSGVTVMPEAQLVPQSPLTPRPNVIDDLVQPSGVYGREYASCSLAGVPIGPCAVAVNPYNPQSGPPRAFPWPSKYSHTLTMSGDGVYDGGTVNINGPAPPADMAGGSAVIVFP